jgi:hypothetical protein
MLFRRREDRDIGAITERIQAVMQRQCGYDVCLAADSLRMPALDLARFLVYEAGVDPQWLLTGEYDGAMHRQVLMLGEDRSAHGRTAVRDFVDRQYRRVRRDAMFSWWPARRNARQHRPKSADAARSA